MCKNLVEKGNLSEPLIIFNRTQQRATDLQSKLPSGKSTVAPTLDEAVANSDIIFTCLGDDAAIQDTIATAIKGDVKGKLFVDCSTVHPDTTNMLAKSIGAQGAHFVACPGQLSNMWVSLRCPADTQLNQSLALLQWPTTVNWSVFWLVQNLMSRKSNPTAGV